ncbi:MAG: acyltransferase, partial [Planctomycetes bacterium]|nr:acyltransferase [Planctomycetota bacterium]
MVFAGDTANGLLETQHEPGDVMRNTGLDLLRLIAVLLVMGRHFPSSAAISGPLGFQVWYTGGWVGVDLFFVLSGFLVSGLLFSEYRRSGEARVGRFLTRRALKIFPAFWVLIAFTVVYLWAYDEAIDISKVAAELLFVQNYFPGYWNYTWTLAVEEHFYLSLAVFVVWRLRARPEGPFDVIPSLFGFIAVFCLVARAFHLTFSDSDSQSWMLMTHTRMDALMFGVLLSYLHHFKNL